MDLISLTLKKTQSCCSSTWWPEDGGAVAAAGCWLPCHPSIITKNQQLQSLGLIMKSGVLGRIEFAFQ